MVALPNLTREDGSAMRLADVLTDLFYRINEASQRGEGLTLSPHEVRAVDYVGFNEPNERWEERWLARDCWGPMENPPSFEEVTRYCFGAPEADPPAPENMEKLK